MKLPSLSRVVRRSLRHYRRTHLAVLAAVAVATAVLTGALVVGDSMRGSLRRLALEGLGEIDQVLVADRFFRGKLAAELEEAPGFGEHFSQVVPAILVSGSVASADGGQRAGQVTLIGAGARFWELGAGGAGAAVARDRVILNRPLADELEVAVGDEVLVRLPAETEVPADSPLGRKSETVRSRRLIVAAILEPRGLGRFSLHPNQQAPQNAYLAPETLQAVLDQPRRVNALLVARRSPGDGEPSSELSAATENWLRQNLRPTLDDYGLAITTAERGYWQLTSRRLMLEAPVERVALDPTVAPQAQPVLAYLANTLAVGERSIPYATVAGLDFTATEPLGPFVDTAGTPLAAVADDQIALGTWAAEQLGARVGDRLRLDYFEPESTHGEVREASVELTVSAIAAFQGAAADRQLVPEVEGVTDQESIADWNPPFPFDANRIRQADEDYWDQYRATPKAFVSLATARRLWASRFGRSTSIRYPPLEGSDPESLATRLRLFPADLGFEFRPVRRQGLAAATGTTPFQWLFLGFSMFLIAAAVLLVLVLFRLGIDSRAAEVGTLAAVGWQPRRIRRALLGEGLVIALLGALLGVAAGVGYAWLMLAGLESWWLDAIRTPFLQLHYTPASLIAGGLAGAIAGGGAMLVALRALARLPVRRLLAGQTEEQAGSPTTAPWVAWLAGGGLVAALGLSLLGAGYRGPAQAGAFFGAGALVLTSLLSGLWIAARARAGAALTTSARWPLGQLAWRNGARHPGRSVLTMGLVAAASFLLVAVSAFRLAPDEESLARGGPGGGFAFWAESGQPIFYDWNTDEGRAELGFSDGDAASLADSRAFALRVRGGDDASCLNLFQPHEPRVLGVPPSLVERGGFAFAASAAASPEERANPWRLLDAYSAEPSTAKAPVPAILDQNTALYSLHLWQGVGARFSVGDGRGGRVELVVVGLLAGSILQGDVLIGEAAFRRHFPGQSGYRAFLIEAPSATAQQVAQTLERQLGDFGFDAVSVPRRLADFQAVQNTYLSTFQSLGGLGLILGTLGLAAVELRNVFERRAELALLGALGFRRRRIAALVLGENLWLLLGGLAVGLVAAAVAVGPHLVDPSASFPWRQLGLTLGLVLVSGLFAAANAVRSALRVAPVAALRGD